MYDHLCGEVVEAHAARVVLRAGSVGYELKVPLQTSRGVRRGEQATLFTILHVVDGMPTLLGFSTGRQRDLARKLMTVSGVGPAVSLALLSSYEPAQIVAAIVSGDAASLRRVRGVGSKLAERLCLELRDALSRDAEPGVTAATPGTLPPASEDAIAALVVLGYPEKEARTKVGKAVSDSAGQTTEDIIRRVLRG